MSTPTRFTLAHVTHEAVAHIGGIGTVLAGLMTSSTYRRHVKRSILIGPTSTQLAVDADARLGADGHVLYSSIDGIDRAGLGAAFRPIELAFNVSIVYGKRSYHDGADERDGEAEVLLIDVFGVNPDRLNLFKLRLWETFGLDSTRYEQAWDYEEYVRLAEPSYYALRALLNDADMPCVLFAHEFMGMPAALASILDGGPLFRTVFHAHECATARNLVERHPGHDLMFYNVLDRARRDGLHVQDVFGPQDHMLRHALISRAYLCDAIIAVGDRTRDELAFLSPEFDDKTIDLVYNGLPAGPVDVADKLRSRRMLADYAAELSGTHPDVLLTHVTRPVISKGIWRDLKVCHELEGPLAAQGKQAVLFILTTGGGVRRSQDVCAMEQHHGWPRHHRQGYPDLVGPEIDIHRDVEAFNATHRAVQVVLVNQFGWERSRIGQRLPAGMDMVDFRRAADVEFGMATYEPFGISPLEPLGAGAVCVISDVCGCQGFVRHVTNDRGTPNVLCADFTSPGRSITIEQLKALQRSDRDRVEQSVAESVAAELLRRLPETDQQRRAMIDTGQKLVARMGWDQVIESGLVPMLERIVAQPGTNRERARSIAAEAPVASGG